MTEIDALKYKLEQQEKAYNKLHKMYVSLLKQQGELEKENKQLKQDNKELRQYLNWQDMELEEIEDAKKTI